MENILSLIEKEKLIKKGEVVGVGVSGGSDSMALLDFLCKNQATLDCEVVAITIDHSIREEGANDVKFVMDFCREKGIRVYKFKVDAPKIAKAKNISIETAAREARYGVFDALVKKCVVDKIATAHHMQDQAETILLHILRGSGLSGAKGIEVKRSFYIRPMLTTSKDEIMDYIVSNNLEYVIDKTNEDNSYSRNFLRNVIMPEVEKKWPTAVNNLVNFGKAAVEDDEYINSQVFTDAIIISDKTAKIPVSYFLYPNAIVTRIIFKALKAIGVYSDIERKHIELLMQLASVKDNGAKINLPNNLVAHKEYDYVSIINKHIELPELEEQFKSGIFEVPFYGEVIVKRVKEIVKEEGELFVDLKKIPKNAVWRLRQDGDSFTKYGGGTKKLKSYLVDKKIPQRIRNFIPVLADGNDILVIAGVEISDKVKVDETTTTICKISVNKI